MDYLFLGLNVVILGLAVTLAAIALGAARRYSERRLGLVGVGLAGIGAVGLLGAWSDWASVGTNASDYAYGVVALMILIEALFYASFLVARPEVARKVDG